MNIRERMIKAITDCEIENKYILKNITDKEFVLLFSNIKFSNKYGVTKITFIGERREKNRLIEISNKIYIKKIHKDYSVLYKHNIDEKNIKRIFKFITYIEAHLHCKTGNTIFLTIRKDNNISYYHPSVEFSDNVLKQLKNNIEKALSNNSIEILKQKEEGEQFIYTIEISNKNFQLVIPKIFCVLNYQTILDLVKCIPECLKKAEERRIKERKIELSFNSLRLDEDRLLKVLPEGLYIIDYSIDKEVVYYNINSIKEILSNLNELFFDIEIDGVYYNCKISNKEK